MNKETEQIRDALVMTKEEYQRRVIEFAEHCTVYNIFSRPTPKISKMEWIERVK